LLQNVSQSIIPGASRLKEYAEDFKKRHRQSKSYSMININFWNNLLEFQVKILIDTVIERIESFYDISLTYKNNNLLTDYI
jgi:hypothetical protein